MYATCPDDVTPAEKVKVKDLPDALEEANEYLQEAIRIRDDANEVIVEWKKYISTLENRFI